jgi:hypothetical protein
MTRVLLPTLFGLALLSGSASGSDHAQLRVAYVIDVATPAPGRTT